MHVCRLSDGATPTCLTCSQEDWELPKSKFCANFFSTITDLTFVYLDTNPAIEESCDYYSASCDQQLDYCILTCSGPTLPFTILVRFDNESDKFEPVQNLESNDIQREAIAELQLPTVQNFVVPEDNGEDECDDVVGSSYEICLLSLFIPPSLPPSLPLSLSPSVLFQRVPPSMVR